MLGSISERLRRVTETLGSISETLRGTYPATSRLLRTNNKVTRQGQDLAAAGEDVCLGGLLLHRHIRCHPMKVCYHKVLLCVIFAM